MDRNYKVKVHVDSNNTEVMANMERDNNTWLQQLGSSGKEQQEALSELRVMMVRSLKGAMKKYSHVDESFVEDSVQDALLLILEKLAQFEGRSQFLTWATSIAIHVSMSKLRRKQWQEVSLDTLQADTHITLEDNSDIGINPDTELDRKNILQKMYVIIQEELTDKQRFALLSELKGVPQDKIARHLGSNRNAIYKLTHDARKRLKHGLEAAGFSAADVNMVFTS